MSNIFSFRISSPPLDLDAPFEAPDEHPPGMRRAVAELAAALASADAAAAPPSRAAARRLGALGAAARRARPYDLVPACATALIAYMRPRHRPEVAEAAREALLELRWEAKGTRDPNLYGALWSSAAVRAASAVLGDIQAALVRAAGSRGAAAPAGPSTGGPSPAGTAAAARAQPAGCLVESRDMLIHYLRTIAYRAPLTAEARAHYVRVALAIMRPLLQDGDKADGTPFRNDRGEITPTCIGAVDEFAAQGALTLLEGEGGLTAPPTAPGAARRFRGERSDGAAETGAGRVADAVAAQPSAVAAATGAIADRSARHPERTEAVLLLTGLLNAASMIESHFALVQELRSPAAGPAALAAGLERWERENRAGGVPLEDYADPLAAIRRALPPAARGGGGGGSRGPARALAAPGAAAGARACAACGKPQARAAAVGGKLLRCTGCDKAHYCSKECQVRHWRAGHKAECRAAHVGRG